MSPLFPCLPLPSFVIISNFSYNDKETKSGEYYAIKRKRSFGKNYTV